jgi:prepilin-type N-terminal cleavage/methylation domain-containing protein
MKTIPMGIPERGVAMNRTATPGGTVGGREDHQANSRARADGSRRGFTLIELLVVISIMALLAALTVSVLHGVSITKYRNVARAELGEIQTALERYKDQYGTYPPSNAIGVGIYASPLTNSLFPPLYYELCGVTNNLRANAFVTMDTIASINVNDVPKAFGMSGFVNCSRGSGDEGTPAKNFLLGLKANRIASVSDNGVWVTNLVTSVGGPDSRYMPLGVANANPIRYVYPGVNNTKGYDLWVQLVISGKTNLICNWSTSPIFNSALP